MEPIPVGVECFFDRRFGYFDAKMGCDIASLVPGGAFHLDKVDIVGIVMVIEEGVTYLVKK